MLVYPDDTVAYVVDTGNSTRPATPEEIAGSLGLHVCQDEKCTKEREYMRHNAVGYRKRREKVEKHRDHIESMALAGMEVDISRDFDATSYVHDVLTSSETYKSEPTAMGASSPSRATPLPPSIARETTTRD